MLPRQLPAQRSDIRIDPLTLLVRKRRQVIPVPLQRVCNLVRDLWRPQLQDRVVVERPVLRALVLAPYLLPLNAEDLHPDAARGGQVVREELGGEGGVAHDDVVGAWFGEHALGEVCGEVRVDREFADDALR